MSDYYSIPRGANWNYGGNKWKLSRTKIALFQECPRCFYLDNKLGLKRPPSYPYNLNTAVDTLLKTEFDAHRANGEQHPLQKEYGLSMRPVAHEQLNAWRANFEGVQCVHKPTGLLVSGAIDDLWIDEDGKYVVVDYKSTAKSEPVTELNDEWHEGYKRQMEIYQWLLRQNGLPVSNTGYFVYCTGRPDAKAFDAKIEFDIHLIPYVGSDDWVDPILENIKKTLESDEIPASGAACDYCMYRHEIGEIEYPNEHAS